MTVRLTVTNSELGAFRTCRRKWELSYEKQLRPVWKHRALRVGSLVHRGIEAMYAKIGTLTELHRNTLTDANILDVLLDVSRDATFQAGTEEITPEMGEEEREEARAAIDEAVPTVARFVEAFGVLDAHRFDVVCAERTFRVPLRDANGTDRGRVTIAGQWDLVLRDRHLDGALVLGENKTTVAEACFLDLKSDVDPQLRTYIYSLGEHYGEPVGRVLYNVVRKKGPREPKINKDGTVSAAAIDTIWSIYNAALEAQAMRGKPITDKQKERLATIPNTIDRYVYRHEMFVNERDVETWRADAYSDASLVRLVKRGVIKPTRNGSFCRAPWAMDCSYRPACDEFVEGGHDETLERIEHRHPELDNEVK